MDRMFLGKSIPIRSKTEWASQLHQNKCTVHRLSHTNDRINCIAVLKADEWNKWWCGLHQLTVSTAILQAPRWNCQAHWKKWEKTMTEELNSSCYELNCKHLNVLFQSDTAGYMEHCDLSVSLFLQRFSSKKIMIILCADYWWEESLDFVILEIFILERIGIEIWILFSSMVCLYERFNRRCDSQLEEVNK